jgi:hypothetical protein
MLSRREAAAKDWCLLVAEELMLEIGVRPPSGGHSEAKWGGVRDMPSAENTGNYEE